MPGSEPPRPRASSLRQRLVEAATERLPYKAAALFLALVLWLVVSAEEPTEDLVPVRLVLLLDSALVLQGEPPTVRALVVGRGRELLKLYGTRPVVRRVVPADSPDTLRIALRPSDVDIPSGIDAIVRDVEPRALELHFVPTAERRVPVRSALRIAPAPGIRLTRPPRFAPESVTVVGPRRAVHALESVPTVRESIVVTDTQPIAVALDTGRVRGRVRPVRVTMSVGAEIEPPALDSAARDTVIVDSAGRRLPAAAADSAARRARTGRGAADAAGAARAAAGTRVVPPRGGPPTGNVAPAAPGTRTGTPHADTNRRGGVGRPRSAPSPSAP